MAKQRPIYTKAQHQIVTPAFVEKKIQLHKSIKWTAQLADVFEQITLFLKNNSGKLDQVVTKELDTYTTHHLKNLLNTNEPR